MFIIMKIEKKTDNFVKYQRIYYRINRNIITLSAASHFLKSNGKKIQSHEKFNIKKIP